MTAKKAATSLSALGFLLVFLAAGIDIGCAMVGVQIFPAPDWLRRVDWLPHLAFWLALAAGLPLVVFFDRLEGGVAQQARAERPTPGKLVLMLLGVLLFSAAFSGAVLRLPVLAAALIAGDEVAFTYTVARDPGFSDRKCRNAVDLEGMPLFSKGFCGLSKEAQMRYARGDRVVIAGKGTAIGVLGRTLRPADAGSQD